MWRLTRCSRRPSVTSRPKPDERSRTAPVVEGRDEFLVEGGQDRFGNSLRTDHENPNVGRVVEVRGFFHGRDIGQLRHPAIAGDGERGELAVLDVRHGQGRRVERELDVVLQQRLEHRGVAAIGHVDHVDVRNLDELHSAQVLRPGDARGAPTDLARVGPDVSQELRQASELRRARLVRGHDEHGRIDAGDRCEVVARMPGQLGEHRQGGV